MDQNHRPLIHRTYGDAMRISVSPQSAFSLTRFGNWPIVVPVFDGYYRDNGFYQVMTLFGLIVVFIVIECNEGGGTTRMDISWAIASHRWLRFLHGSLHRRLRRLNDVQNREDNQIRDRRIALRSVGYRFVTDTPDFVNANVVANNVIFPPVSAPQSISVAELPEGLPHLVELRDRAYLMRRAGDNVDVWPGVCPHEGAPITPNDVRGDAAKCCWHDLEFPARRLVASGPGISLCGARLQLSDARITVSPIAGNAADAR